MKKISFIALVLLLCLSMTACSAKKAENNANLPNPMTTYTSLEELNTAAGTTLPHPGVMGVSNEKFVSISFGDGLLAEYSFDLSGYTYTLRSAATTDDISGYYVDGKTAFDGADTEGIAYFEDSSAKLSRWFTVDGQFVLMVSDEGKMSMDTFEGISEEMRFTCTPSLSPVAGDLSGEYADSYSQRAILNAEALDETSYHITVEWANSASELMRWEMTATLYEDGLLSYTDGTCSLVSFDADGKESAEVQETEQEGFFALQDEKLLWSGAADESCQNCSFEKMVY